MTDGNSRKPEGDKFLARIRNLEAEKKALAEDIKEVWQEAKLKGHDIEAMREVLRAEKMKEKMGEEAFADLQDAIEEYKGVFG